MTSRERVLAALNHTEPDRIPIDLSGHRSSGIMAMAYARLLEFLDLPERPIRVYDPVQQLAVVDEDVLERFKVDTIELGRAFALEDRWWSDWVLPDGTPCLMPIWANPENVAGDWVIRSKTSNRVISRMPRGVIYFEQTYWPFAEQDDLDRIREILQESMWTAIASPPGPIVAGPNGP
jgi:uroporphyrinogen decarboxylase